MQNLTGDIHHFYTEKGAGFLCSRYPRTRKNTTRECAIYYPPVCRRSAPLHGPAPHKKGAYARVLGRRQYCACFCPAAPERVDRVILKPSTASFWIFYTRQGSTEKKGTTLWITIRRNRAREKRTARGEGQSFFYLGEADLSAYRGNF